MNNLHSRLQRLERGIEREPGPWLIISPDTTFEAAKADLERKTGTHLSDDEFKKLLPSCNLVYFTVVSREGERRNQWYEELREEEL